MKRILAAVLFVILMLSCIAAAENATWICFKCGRENGKNFCPKCGQASPSPTPVSTYTPSPTHVPIPTPSSTPVPTPANVETKKKDEGIMSYEEYAAAAVDTAVCVETYVQDKQSWWDNKATVYAQSEDGAYFLYNMACSEEDYAKLVPGTKIKVTGFKSEWSGEVEIIDAAFEIEEGQFIAEAADVTALLGTEDLIKHQNEFVSFKGMTVESAGKDADGNDVAFLYKWDGSGADGDDLYFNVSLDGTTYSFTVESYLRDNTTDVYAAVKALNIGDKIDMEGFLYWYEGANPHITTVTATPIGGRNTGW